MCVCVSADLYVCVWMFFCQRGKKANYYERSKHSMKYERWSNYKKPTLFMFIGAWIVLKNLVRALRFNGIQMTLCEIRGKKWRSNWLSVSLGTVKISDAESHEVYEFKERDNQIKIELAFRARRSCDALCNPLLVFFVAPWLISSFFFSHSNTTHQERSNIACHR